MRMMEDFVELPLHPSGVYMLVWRGRVVYVGQSMNVLSRFRRIGAIMSAR